MVKERSESCCYQSNFGGGFVTAPQYLIECLCFLVARKDKIQLVNRFWTQPRWAKHFRWQVKPVNELLKIYSSEVILDALRDRRCWNIASFGNKSKLLPIIQEKQIVCDTKMQRIMQLETPICGDTTSKPRPPNKMSKKSIFSMLKEEELHDKK